MAQQRKGWVKSVELILIVDDRRQRNGRSRSGNISVGPQFDTQINELFLETPSDRANTAAEQGGKGEYEGWEEKRVVSTLT